MNEHDDEPEEMTLDQLVNESAPCWTTSTVVQASESRW